VTFDLHLDLEHTLDAGLPGDHRVQVWSRSGHLPGRRSDLRKSLQTDGRTDRRTDDGRRAIALAHSWNELINDVTYRPILYGYTLLRNRAVCAATARHLLGHPEPPFRTGLCFSRDVSFFRHAFSEIPRPITLKLCHMIRIWPYFIN